MAELAAFSQLRSKYRDDPLIALLIEAPILQVSPT
jgi:hypothetical protein